MTRRLIAVLEAAPDLWFAWLHGSFLGAGEFHDIDVGVHLSSTTQEPFQRGLEESFSHLGAMSAELLLDQMKAVVASDGGGSLIENPKFPGFSNHWGFRARACRPCRARTKGKALGNVRQADVTQEPGVRTSPCASDRATGAAAWSHAHCKWVAVLHARQHSIPELCLPQSESAIKRTSECSPG